MKKILTTIAALTLAAGVTSQAQTNVASQNAVGYVRVAIEPGEFALVNVPFYEVGNTSPITITELIGDQMTGDPGIVGNSDFIIKWNKSLQTYEAFWKKSTDNTWRDFTDFFNATTSTVSAGDAFFVQNNQTNSQSLYIMGEVPDSVTNPTNVTSLVTGFNMNGLVYPVDVAITNLTISDVAVQGLSGDQIIRWVSSNQTYKAYFYDNIGFGGPSTIGWKDFNNIGGPPTSDVIPAGEGFFYNRTGSVTNWTEVKPYVYP